jgi:hypothetical protein
MFLSAYLHHDAAIIIIAPPNWKHASAQIQSDEKSILRLLYSGKKKVKLSL